MNTRRCASALLSFLLATAGVVGCADSTGSGTPVGEGGSGAGGDGGSGGNVIDASAPESDASARDGSSASDDGGDGSDAATRDPRWTAGIDRAFEWMASVKQPNGLYDSQADGADICYTYDQAVAVVAFLSVGNKAAALELLARLAALQESTGSWYTAYDGKSEVAEASEWVGPVAWVAMAAAAYKTQTGSTQFDAMAKSALEWCLKYQQASGGIKGGKGEDGSALDYTSTEENEDAYAALNFFGFTAQAEKVRTFLLTVWVPAEQRWLVGPDNTAQFLDPNAWGVQSLLDKGPTGYAAALDFNLKNMRLKKTVNAITVDGFDFNDDKDDVWLEGTAQMAAALYTVGRTSEGDRFIGEVMKFQKASGGIPYSMAGGTTGDDWNMPKVEAISSTGWFVVAAMKVNPFHYEAR